MNKWLYEILARVQADGTAAVQARDITTIDGRDYEGDPRPLTVADEEFVEFGAAFSAAAVAQRDAALADLAERTTERDEARALAAERAATIAALEAQVAAYEAQLNPPDDIFPYDFQELLTDEQLVTIQLATDAALIRLRTKVQTIVTPMPYGEGSELQQAVHYLGLALPELFPPAEVARILARQAPE